MTQDKPKRKYSERRTDLKKEFICQHEGCSRKYSSRIAFNHHLKQKHMAKKLEIQWFSASFIKSNFKFRNSLFIFLCYIKTINFSFKFLCYHPLIRPQHLPRTPSYPYLKTFIQDRQILVWFSGWKNIYKKILETKNILI